MTEPSTNHEESVMKPQLVGFELSFYIGKRIFLAAISTIVLAFSLITIKASNAGSEQLLAVENREEPIWVLSVVGIYMLGVATDLDLTLPLKMLHGKSKDGQ
jgi:hypothetical protein